MLRDGRDVLFHDAKLWESVQDLICKLLIPAAKQVVWVMHELILQLIAPCGKVACQHFIWEGCRCVVQITAKA